VIVSSDLVRKRRANVDAAQRMSAAYGEGIYGGDERARVYDAMRDIAREHLELGRSVILDATHIRRADRDAAAWVAKDAGVPMFGIELAVDEAIVRARLDARMAGPGTPSDAGWNVYLAQRERFQPPHEVAASRRISIDGGAPVRESIDAVVSAITSV